MNIDRSILKNRILWKVYAAWFFKRILPLLAVELCVLAFALYFLARFVFVERVVGNTLVIAAHHPLSLFSYMLVAFIGTPFLTKIVIIALLSLGILLMRDIGRAIVSYRLTSKAAKPKP